MSPSAASNGGPLHEGLDWLSVEGFKSHFQESRIEFPGLTILCGANSSGKSSAMQPLLLLKQTFDSLPYDYGPLRLDGPNVFFNHVDQMLATRPGLKAPRIVLQLGYRVWPMRWTEVQPGIAEHTRDPMVEGQTRIEFTADRPGVKLAKTTYTRDGESLVLEANTPSGALPAAFRTGLVAYPAEWTATRELRRTGSLLQLSSGQPEEEPVLLQRELRQLLHLSGLRGQPERHYPRVQLETQGMHAQGLFHIQAPSWVAHWTAHDKPQLERFQAALGQLGLTWKVQARQRDAASIEIMVGRSPRPQQGGAHDLVNIADVGFGVSQSLPVAVALVGGQPGQLIYIEQPEIHLHPRAHAAMADLIADAVNRSCKVVIETHSDTLLRRVQTLIARGTLAREKVIAHWFSRGGRGETKITTVVPEVDGSLGEWPEDFSEVDEEIDRDYADAAFARLKAVGT